MYEAFSKRLKQQVLQNRPDLHLELATKLQIENAETALGFQIPELLKSLYLHVGNGGFGPGKGGTIISLDGGDMPTDCLAGNYQEMKRGAEWFGRKWPAGLLPFCDWGCAIYTCVDCNVADATIYRCEECTVKKQAFNLTDFVTMWADGVDLFHLDTPRRPTRVIINPFTRKPETLRGD